MIRLAAMAVLGALVAAEAQAGDVRLWIVTPAPRANLRDCPQRAADAVKNRSADARLLTSNAVVEWPNSTLPICGEAGAVENPEDLSDRCFALTAGDRVVVSGATLRPYSARLLRLPVLQVMTRRQGEALRFKLTPAFPAELSQMPPQTWNGMLSRLTGGC
jgi:hypothetical protein